MNATAVEVQLVRGDRETQQPCSISPQGVRQSVLAYKE
jgi:hypothetical protein